jgi:hypothetical protein
MRCSNRSSNIARSCPCRGNPGWTSGPYRGPTRTSAAEAKLIAWRREAPSGREGLRPDHATRGTVLNI